MPFVPVPNCAQAQVLWGPLAGAGWSNTLHYTKTSFSVADMEALQDAIDTTILASDWRSTMASAWYYKGTNVIDLRTEGATIVPANASGQGSQSNDPLALNLAICVTLRTALRGRSYRGRVYLSGLNEQDMTNGAFTPAAYGNASLLITQLIANPAAIGWNMCIVSRSHNGIPLTVGVPTAVTTAEVRIAKPASQRSRLRREG